MFTSKRVASLWLASALLLAAPAGASIPGGTLESRYYEGILHVCSKDAEPGSSKYVVCNDQVGADTQAEYTASECMAAGMEPVCVADFVPKTRVKLLLTLIVDDDAKDAGNNNDGTHAAVILQGKYKGATILLSDLFFDSKIGNWNSFSEAELVAVAEFIFDAVAPDNATWEVVQQFANLADPTDNLADVGDRLLEIVDSKHPLDLAAEGVVPVLTSVKALPKKGDADETGSLVGSTSVFKITIEFARVR